MYPDDLRAVWRTQSWRWFAVRVAGLLATESPLARYFASSSEE